MSYVQITDVQKYSCPTPRMIAAIAVADSTAEEVKGKLVACDNNIFKSAIFRATQHPSHLRVTT